MNIQDRILKYLEFKGITPYKFYKETGISNGYLGKTGSIGSDKCEIICSHYPDFNPEWLLLGNGDMLKSEKQSDLSLIHEQIISYNDKVIEIPIMDVTMAAGITGYINNSNFDTLDHIIFPSNMIRKSFHVCVKTKGESMSPTILDSDNVVIRLLDRSEWFDMPDEHVYVIVDSEGKGYIKRVKNRMDKGFIVCMSDNIDKLNYPNFNLAMDELISVWHAEWHISAKMPNINENYYSRVKQLEDQFDEIKNTLASLNK